MKEIVLLYDPLEEETVQNEIVPAFEGHTVQFIPFRQDDPKCNFIHEESFVVTYLTDVQLTEVVAGAALKKWTIGFLPHPGMIQARQGYGIATNLDNAIEDILQNKKEIKSDLLLCNGIPVFNKVVIGNSLSLMTGSVSKNTFYSSLEKAVEFFKQSKSLQPRAFTITAENKKPLQTAALGIIAVQHGKSTLLSRKLIKNSFINDGRLHSLILAPKSITELLRFSFSSFFNDENGKLPSFIGHIKASSITISSPTPMDYTQDNNLLSAKEIDLRISVNKFLIIPGRHLVADNSADGADDKYRVSALPTGEEHLVEITARPLPFIYHASTEEFKGLFQVLRDNAKATGSYLTLMVLSSLLATFGLFANSSPVIIGAMILAPLMAPIISLSMGVLRQEKKLMIRSARTIGYSLLLGYLAAILVTLIIPLQSINDEIIARIKPNLIDLGVAIVSGIAGAYAHARSEVAKTLAGVAIAVALVPPLAVSGIGIGWGDWQVFTGALLLFSTNLAGIVLAGIITFLLLGFSPMHLAKKGLVISILIAIIVSLPLGYGTLTMITNYNVVRSLNESQVGDITIKEVSVIRGSDPMALRVTLVAYKPITESDIDKVKQSVTDRLGREVELEVLTSIRR
nr:TIGR00341 family protein [Pontibacter harenae]